MAKISQILIEGNEGEWGWFGNCRCPRQPPHEDTKNMFCSHREECILPQIFIRAEKQAGARQKMSSVRLPKCLDHRELIFLDQAPQPCHEMPSLFEADFVIKA